MCRTAVATFAFAAVFAFALGAPAQTPDGETPANEGVCDELIGATPGLYGLCVAYCEAQDCDSESAVSGQCAAKNPKILENYNKKKGSGDPDMPCIQDPCPCFTVTELELNGFSGCTEFPTGNISNGPRLDLWILGTKERAMVRDVQSQMPRKGDPQCTFVGFSDEGTYVKRGEQSISSEAVSYCRLFMENYVAANNLTCNVVK